MSESTIVIPVQEIAKAEKERTEKKHQVKKQEHHDNAPKKPAEVPVFSLISMITGYVIAIFPAALFFAICGVFLYEQINGTPNAAYYSIGVITSLCKNVIHKVYPYFIAASVFGIASGVMALVKKEGSFDAVTGIILCCFVILILFFVL